MARQDRTKMVFSYSGHPSNPKGEVYCWGNVYVPLDGYDPSPVVGSISVHHPDEEVFRQIVDAYSPILQTQFIGLAKEGSGNLEMRLMLEKGAIPCTLTLYTSQTNMVKRVFS